MTPRFVRLVILFATLASTSWWQATAQKSGAIPQKDSEYSAFLRGLSSIPEWAAKLESSLRSQGAQIDQRKAKQQLLPKVIAIQRSLSALEDINARILDDAGSSVQRLDRPKMRADLIALMEQIRELQRAFADLRQEVQVISIPDITSIERIAEDAIHGKGAHAADSLAMLGYGNHDPGGQPDVHYAELRRNSEANISLLHQAQDAFAKLHRYLEN